MTEMHFNKKKGIYKLPNNYTILNTSGYKNNTILKALEKFSNFELGHLDEIKCIKKSVFTVSLSTATEV